MAGGACSDDPEPLARREAKLRIDPSFVGRLGDTKALIGLGITAEGSQVIAYVTDGDAGHVGRSGATSEWFVGGALGGNLALTAQSGARLEAGIEGDTARGAVTFSGGQRLEFTAEKARGDDAGLYREEAKVGDVGYLLGWIVLNDGEERGTSYPPFIRCPAVVAAICS